MGKVTGYRLPVSGPPFVTRYIIHSCIHSCSCLPGNRYLVTGTRYPVPGNWQPVTFPLLYLKKPFYLGR